MTLALTSNLFLSFSGWVITISVTSKVRLCFIFSTRVKSFTISLGVGGFWPSCVKVTNCPTVSSLLGLDNRKVDGVVRVWQCGQTASLPRMIGGAA